MVSQRTIQILTRTSGLLVLMFFMFGCASYHDRITDYYQKIGNAQYTEADKALEKNGLIKKPRNKLLYDMEKGRLAHLQGQYATSNLYLNNADLAIEDGMGSTGDVAVGLFLNSMSQNYKGEEFEIFMLHYYKSLNYMYLGQTESAIVEARRISLQNYEQGDKYNNKAKRYSKDAFSLILQGLIYEYSGDFNDAFIAYRNAVEVFQKSNGEYYGVRLPDQLKEDVMRMAYKMGFTGDLIGFEKQFNLTFEAQASPGGDLIIFWENGMAPVKIQENILFSLVKGEDGALVFTNALGFVIPIDFGIAGKTTLNDVHSLNVAYPKYISQPLPFSSAKIRTMDGKMYSFETVENIDVLANETLRERAGKELGKILTRMAVKKSAEYAVKAAAKNNGKNGDNNALLEGIGLGIQLFTLVSEKADTRNWQSLPSQINYIRVPLQEGKNELMFELMRPNGQLEVKELTIEGNGRMKFYNFATLK